MRRIYFFLLGILGWCFVNAQCPTFTIGAPFGTTVGCSPNTIQLDAFNTSTLANVTFTWISSTGTQFGPSITASCPGATNIFTISASASAGTCISTETFAITSNTVAPNISVSPATRTLTCNGACQSFTATTTTTTNVYGTWNNSGAVSVGPASSPLVLCASNPGTYTAVFTDTVTGCSSSQSVSVVASNTVIPSMSILSSSPNVFTITCTNPSVPMYINFTGTIAPIGYTWVPVANPTASTTPATGGYTATLPGQYVAIAQDGFMCKISTTVSIFMDTIRPAPFAHTNLSGNSFTLDCNTTSLVATALSAPLMASSSYSWITPPSTIVNSNTISVSLSNITTSATPTTYTVIAAGANGCVRGSKVFFYKDTYIPPYSIAFTPSAITCANPCVALSPVSSTSTPVDFTFTSPPPTQTATTSGAIMCIPGSYTMTYHNTLNGCIGSTTAIVPNNAVPPPTFSVGPYVIPCGYSSVQIAAGTVSTNPTYSYSWSGPAGGGISCPGGPSCYMTDVDTGGTYTVNIIDTANGCSSTNTMSVVQYTNLIINVTGNTSICSGETATLNVTGATSYTWSSGSTTNTEMVSPTTGTTYTVNGMSTMPALCYGQATVAVIVNPCVGIKEFSANAGISISPNPNNGKFYVDLNSYLENAEIKIINAIGQEVLKQNIKQGRTEVNATMLAKGIYHYVIIQNKEPVDKGKIVVD